MTPVQVNHERGMVFLDTGGDCVILARSEAKIDPDDHDVHHAFIVADEDYEASKKDLIANGVDVFFEEDRQGGAVNGPRAYFHDPDGNVLEIINLTSYKGEPAV
jgi:catechol 2,3-dioxygenase-like lactoylglutathione lyase family enzyme